MNLLITKLFLQAYIYPFFILKLNIVSFFLSLLLNIYIKYCIF